MLQLQEVRKTYKMKAGEVGALNGVSLTFPETGLVFITGKSGCGKTTLLNVIGGLDGIDSGEVLIQDKKFSTFSADEYDRYRNTFIGFIFQEYNLLPEFTVEKNIKMAMELQGRKADEEAFEQLLKDVEIDGLKKRKISELSGGQRQRVAIARALVKNPRIIMADEPTGALDSATGVQVLDTLKKLSKKTLIIVVSHDWDFAERYADRIIHLEDGKVAQDVTFTEKEISANVSEQGEKFIVREGSDLSENEKNALAKAVKERKVIEIIENPCFRDKEPTGEIAHRADKPVSLRKSKMKLKSSAHLGLKSLIAKPVRLVLTVLIAALAFAVFGICDTIANFNTSRILRNQLKIAPSQTVISTFDFVANPKEGDAYEVKVSQDVVDEFGVKTGGAVKGVFDFVENRTDGLTEDLREELKISEIQTSTAKKGRKYYTQSVNGFVEFDEETEISEDGVFKDFGYRIVEGRYPGAVYQDGVINYDALSEVAISTYLADSIIHYLDGRPMQGVKITTYKALLNTENLYFNINRRQYKIVGIIDCGSIPAKYNEIKTATSSNTINTTLLNDFTSYIDSSAHKLLFVGKGLLKAQKADDKMVDIYYGGNVTWSFSVDGRSGIKSSDRYVYNAEKYDANNILLFSNEYPSDGKITLADDEILIHSRNLRELFAAKIQDYSKPTEIYNLIEGMQKGTVEENREALSWILDEINANLENPWLYASIGQKFFQANNISKTTHVKIVGVYFGVDVERNASISSYRLMMNTNLMDELKIYSGQGDYSKILFSAKSARAGGGAIVPYLLADNGLRLNWYNNSVLEIVRTNETTIRQGANLFMYADLALSVFAIFMLYSYISASIASKKQSVGILRALGAGGKNILLTFLIESLIVALINGLLANIFAAVGCMLVNTYIVKVMNLSVHFALFGGRQIAIITLISFLTAIISSLLPIIRISKKKPVELIRR